MNHTKRLREERDRYRELALEMEFRLKQAERRNIEHEDDYMAVWKAIKEPNETLLDSCKRVVRERDDLRINAETNREGMAKAQRILDSGRWAGYPLIEAAVTELEEARAALVESSAADRERKEVLEQVENLGKFIGRPGMTAAHIVTEAVSEIERLRRALDSQNSDLT